MILIKINVRPCNSKNLNQSPFCKTGNKNGPLKWAEEASNLYNKTGYIPEYVRKLKTSLRNVHGTRRLKEDEIFSGNEEVPETILKTELKQLFIRCMMLMRKMFLFSTFSWENLLHLVGY